MARRAKRPGSPFPHARKVIPKDVRGIIGRREFKQPLHGDPAEVRRKHVALTAQWEGEIAAARAQLAGKLRSLTLREIDAICGEFYRSEFRDREDDPGSVEQRHRACAAVGLPVS